MVVVLHQFPTITIIICCFVAESYDWIESIKKIAIALLDYVMVLSWTELIKKIDIPNYAMVFLTIVIVLQGKKALKYTNDQSIKPRVDLMTKEENFTLVNSGIGPALNLRLTLLDPEGIDNNTLHGEFLNRYVRLKLEQNPELRNVSTTLAPNQRLQGTLLDFKEYEKELLKHLDLNNIKYHKDQGVHIWHYKAVIELSYENTEGEKYYSCSDFNFLNTKGKAAVTHPYYESEARRMTAEEFGL